MKTDTLWTILKDELNAEKIDARWKLPVGTRITVFLKGATSLFPVSKITAIEIKTAYIILESEENRVFTDLSEVVAIRADEEASSSDSRLGFG